MCDTLGRVKGNSTAIFAKNSDRSPNEPQILEFIQAKHSTEEILKATYIEIKQAEYTHALLLSRPTWLWGGEMGVNDCGVCIGNEAVFTKGKYSKNGLIGMDLLRLGLERSGNAKEALEVIISNLEQYGQGGNCGYDNKFYYDNSFLIMDRDELYILETAGREWVWKKSSHGNISNRLSIGDDGDCYSGGKIDFKAKHFEPVFSFFSGSSNRKSQTSDCSQKAQTVSDMMSALRVHKSGNINQLTSGSVSSTCMHAGGIVGDHTTASMIVELGDDIRIWATGSSTPCISCFKPYGFGNEITIPVVSENAQKADSYWRRREDFHRSVIGRELPKEFYDKRNEMEESWIKQSKDLSLSSITDLSKRALDEETQFYENLSFLPNLLSEKPIGTKRFLKYWEKKNKIL